MKKSVITPSLIPPLSLGGGKYGGGISCLVDKLTQLREKLHVLETEGREKMKEQILRNDLHDDLRENEGAKMTMLDHDILLIRIRELKGQIFEVKKKIIGLRMED